MTSPIVVEGLTKRYTSGVFARQSVLALDELNLRVESGEIFGLLGPNGAGKTTLVKLLLGIVRPSSGTALLLGHPAGRPIARQRIGYLPENHRFPDFLTATQMLDLYGQMAGVPASERTARIPELLERVRIARWRDTKIRKYSKGMMQRLGLAQALLNHPDLLFLDEPTDGVDPVGRHEIRDLLLWLRDQGTTIFLNSHLLSEVEQVCTRVAILHHGRLIREGNIETLTATDHAYDVICTPIPDALLASWPDQVMPLDSDPQRPGLYRYRIHLPEREALNVLIDHLRQAGVLLEAVQPMRRTLEESFIDVVTTMEDA